MVVGCCRKVMYMCNQVSNRLLFRSNLPLSFPNKSWCITWVSCRHRLTSKWCNHIFTIMACFVLIYNEFCFAVSWCCLLHPYFPSFSVYLTQSHMYVPAPINDRIIKFSTSDFLKTMKLYGNKKDWQNFSKEKGQQGYKFKDINLSNFYGSMTKKCKELITTYIYSRYVYFCKY